MKKIFTLAATVLASFSLWAVEPNYGSYDWGADDFATVFANHDGIVLSSDASAWKGNFSGIQYVALGGGTDMSAASPTPYFGITADAPIDSIEVFWAPNGTNNTSVAWAGWEEASQLLNQTVVAMGKTETYAASKSYEAAIWQKIDLSGYNFKAVMLARQIKKAIINDKQQSNLGDNQTVNILGIRVWVRETKEVDHVDVTLGGVAVNGEALSDTQMATLYGALTLNLTAEYVEAPTVTFTVQTDTYYVGEETPSTKSENIDVVTALNHDGKWQAQQTVGEQTYTITAVKPATATVTYMDGATVLGEEIVKVGELSTKHANFETKPLAEFQGWYTDAELTSEADLTAAVNADKILYGKFVKAYAQSLNIEQLVVTNGKSYGIKDALTAAGYEYSNLDALDSLNNEKGAARNEPYLGLKIKTQGGFIACNVATGSTIRVKFGYVENNVLAIAGNDTLTLTPANKTLDVLEFTAEADTYVKIQTTSGKTVVIKQIMVDEAITDVMYKITYAEAEHGTVSGWTIAFPNEEVKLSFTLDEGYTVASCFANDVEIVGIPNVGEFFTMPAEAVTVTATFSTATAIENTAADAKVAKRVINGQLFIEKNGVVYNAQGAIVK